MTISSFASRGAASFTARTFAFSLSRTRSFTASAAATFPKKPRAVEPSAKPVGEALETSAATFIVHEQQRTHRDGNIENAIVDYERIINVSAGSSSDTLIDIAQSYITERNLPQQQRDSNFKPLPFQSKQKDSSTSKSKARLSSSTETGKDGGFKPLPFQSSLDQGKNTTFKPLPFQSSKRNTQQGTTENVNKNVNFAPLPFQTVHHTLSQKGAEKQTPVAQNDWLADSDDVSGRTGEILSSMQSAENDELSSNHSARVTGDVPHLDLAESLEDVSVEDVGKLPNVSGKPIDLVNSHVNHRNSANDADSGYGVSAERAKERLDASQIPYVDPSQISKSTASNSSARSTNTAAREQKKTDSLYADTGSIDELIDDTSIVNEDLKSESGYVPGEHQVSVGQGARGARFTSTKVGDASTRPGASN